MGTVGAVLLVIGLTVPLLALIGTGAYVLHLGAGIRSLEPGARPAWHLLLLHVGIVTGVQLVLTPLAVVPPLGGIAGTGVGALAAMAVMPLGLRARLRRLTAPGPSAYRVERGAGPTGGAQPQPSRRPWGLATLFGFTGLLLPWTVAVGVKLYLDAHGQPTLPFTEFLGPAEVPILLVLTATSWAFPFLLLGVAVLMRRMPWLGATPSTSGSRLPVWLAYAVGVMAGVPLFIGVFRQFDFIYLIVPLGLLMLAPMGVAYVVGTAVTRRRAGRSSVAATGPQR
ncbi:MAG: hypothetical protein GWM90_27780 [Gemmatimonadetes bacterium]|nr:hypothetical protein [Gemmatimonadota bacterium]NIU78980.1 hypothetical protein [Gammaproteobacteria bacterium]NIQ58809.1 hypothetical protein [Gemmatimonadota bacterium]NIW35909.1 hypothetical protein [Gemmatimonadota bacterium]NIX47729.1 hypothetical protein [Gemmatimonadota bacterium]